MYVINRDGYVVLTYGQHPDCANKTGGNGAWFVTFTVTGELVGDFDTISVQLREGHVNYPGMPYIVDVEQPVP